jgi:antirestriction protein ArdC
MLLAGTEDARGYRQWQATERHVRKGARAFSILGPCKVKRSQVDEESGEEVVRVMVVGFRTIPVFRIEDTDGKPIERAEYRPAELPPLFETTAVVLARLWNFELDTVAKARDYIESYAGDPAKAVMKVLADVQAVLELILGPSGREAKTAGRELAAVA